LVYLVFADVTLQPWAIVDKEENDENATEKLIRR
jgi:hypothetical protein